MLRGSDCRFEEPWPVDTEIPSWNRCRRLLNGVIEAYNQWQVDGCPPAETGRVDRMLCCAVQTWAKGQEQEGYREVLERMLAFVEERLLED